MPTNTKTQPKQDQAAIILRVVNVNACERLPDSDRYKYRFKVRSESSSSLYLVSWDDAPGARWWTCSCRGNIGHGNCKHLKSMGLMGRTIARTLPLNDPRRMLPGRPSY